MAYEPKNPHLSPNRVQKISKDLITDCKKDRELAFESYKYFKAQAEENPQDNTAKGLMVDCLKVMQSSKNNVVKILNLIVKMEDSVSANSELGKTTASKGPLNPIFHDLSKLLND